MTYQILAVDDDPVNQKIIGLLLKALGLDFKIAKNGREAIEEYKKEAPDLILMDIMMPEIDGYHASLEIRRHEFGKGRTTPIIACTALDYQFVKERCIGAAINDYISKPISRELLKNKLELWLQQKIKVENVDAPLPFDRDVANRVRWANVLDDGPIDRKYLKLVYGLEQLDDIFALFLTVTEDLMKDLQAAVKSQDSDATNSLAHELKASSYAVGARVMANCCLQLEQAGLADDWVVMRNCLSAIEDAFEDLQIFVQQSHDIHYASKRSKSA